MLKKSSLVAIGVASAFVVACGGGGDGSVDKRASSGQVQEIKAQFIDAPVKGLNVKTSKGNTKTGDNGMFNCLAGETVTFSLRGLALGYASCGEKIFIDEVEGVDVDNAAAVMQSLSKTEANTGLIDLSDIPDSANLAAIDLDSADITVDIATAKSGELNGVTTVSTVSAADARTHVDAQLAEHATLSSNIKTSLLALAGSQETIYLGAKLTQGSVENCYKYVTAPMKMSVKAGMPTFTISEYIESDEKFYTTCNQAKKKSFIKAASPQIDCNVSVIDSSAQNAYSFSKMITANRFAAGYNIVAGLTEGEDGNLEVRNSFPNGNNEQYSFFFEDEEANPLPIKDVPTAMLTGHGEFFSFNFNLSQFPKVSGTALMSFTNLELYSWSSETNYELRRSKDICGYSFQVINP